MCVHQAVVLYYKTSDVDQRPSEKSRVDLRISKEEYKNLETFKQRLLNNEGLMQRSHLLFSKFNVRVGYCQNLPSKQQGAAPTLGMFVESVSNEQFEICMNRVEKNPSTYQLTFKVSEKKNPFFEKRIIKKPKTQSVGSCRSDDEITNVINATTTTASSTNKTTNTNSTTNTTSTESSTTNTTSTESSTTNTTSTTSSAINSTITSKRGVKRSHAQADEDDRLWKDLRNGAAVVRNERQQERLDKWVTVVAGKSEKFQAIDERRINCTACNNLFTVNKFNALGDIGKNHKKCLGKSKSTGKQLKLFFLR